MARCPFANWDEITGGLGAFSGGPYKIVHHTTEGPSYAGARAAYAANRSDPHFTVDAQKVYQHIDTAETARSLRNDPGGVQTNRDSAVQIEVVAYAGKPKHQATLQNVARLCRWIESTHGVAQTWPNGFPRYSINGSDPGGHNRNQVNWDGQGGHYGHSQVPENIHWDPGYTPNEIRVVTPEAAPAELFARPGARVAAVRRGKATSVAVGPRVLVAVLFTGRDYVSLRLRDVRGKGAVAQEILVDTSQGLAAAYDLATDAAVRRGSRKLMIDASVNGTGASVRREGKVLVVETRVTRRGSRRSGRRECARIVVANFATPSRPPRGSCPT